MPRPPPPDTVSRWRTDVDGVGHVFINGPVVRGGERTYLLHVRPPGSNAAFICLLRGDGSIVKWYTEWEGRRAELEPVIAAAREFVLADFVMTS